MKTTAITNKITTRVAIYVRTSRTDQILDNQKLPLVEYCQRMGYTYEVFEEQESTRKTRPIQWNLYQQLLKKHYDGLIIYKFDRWARSTKELIEHIENMMAKGVFIYSYTENFDLNTPMGRAMLTILSAFSQLERDIIRERTLAGLHRARMQGKKLGRPSKAKSKKRPSRKEVSNLMVKGFTVREIAKKLDTSKYWAHEVMKEVRELSVGVGNEGGVFR